MTRFIIDTDTASDDAVALVMALKHPTAQVEAITVVAGNVPLEQAVQNALYTVELCGSQVPVYAGLSKPLMRKLETAQFVHGQDGMGDIGLPLTGRSPAAGHAVDKLIETIRQHAGEIILVTLGPLTNVAAALLRAPEIAQQVTDCIIMGGTGRAYGNVTPVAEFNIWCDPEAAKIVFESGMPLRMIGWDMSYTYAVMDAEDCRRLKAHGTALAAFCVDINVVVDAFAKNDTQLAGFDLPDPITMAVALQPACATFKRLHVAIEIGDGLCRGQTVVDHLGMTGHTPQVEVAWTVDRAAFLALLHAAVVA